MYQPDKLAQNLNELLGWAGLQPCQTIAENISNVVAHPTRAPEKDFAQMSNHEKQEYFRERSAGWKNWTDVQRNTFLEICGPFMNRAGYQIPFDK